MTSGQPPGTGASFWPWARIGKRASAASHTLQAMVPGRASASSACMVPSALTRSVATEQPSAWTVTGRPWVRPSRSYAHRVGAEVWVRGWGRDVAQIDAGERAQLLGGDPRALLGRLGAALVLVETQYSDPAVFLCGKYSTGATWQPGRPPLEPGTNCDLHSPVVTGLHAGLQAAFGGKDVGEDATA
ncbi:hypothetical protein [Streptomyces virginiae]